MKKYFKVFFRLVVGIRIFVFILLRGFRVGSRRSGVGGGRYEVEVYFRRKE